MHLAKEACLKKSLLGGKPWAFIQLFFAVALLQTYLTTLHDGFLHISEEISVVLLAKPNSENIF